MKLHQFRYLLRHPFLCLADISTSCSELSVEALNLKLMIKKFLRSNLSYWFLLEVTEDFLQLSLQLFLKITLMNLVDEELLNIELDVFRDVQIIKRSIRLDRPNLNKLQDLLWIEEKRDFRTRCFSFAARSSSHILNFVFLSGDEGSQILKLIFLIRSLRSMRNGATHGRLLWRGAWAALNNRFCLQLRLRHCGGGLRSIARFISTKP